MTTACGTILNSLCYTCRMCFIHHNAGISHTTCLENVFNKIVKMLFCGNETVKWEKINFRASLKVGSCLADSGLHLMLEMTKLNI